MNSTCFIDGVFFFTPLHYEVKGIRAEIEDAPDYDIVDEVAYTCPEDDNINRITLDFLKTGKLNDDDRESLINYYVLFHIEDYLMIMNDGEM